MSESTTPEEKYKPEFTNKQESLNAFVKLRDRFLTRFRNSWLMPIQTIPLYKFSFGILDDAIHAHATREIWHTAIGHRRNCLLSFARHHTDSPQDVE